MPLLADRYEMGPLIGQGGMAEVYSATDTRLDRPVAVKVMRAEVAYQRLVRERFEAEARMAARLVHPNVVSVFDSGEQDGIPYIVMELLPGETLRDRMRSGPMSEPEVRAMAVEVLSALELAHRSGILHRDIKPANILIAGGGHWKVTDFGIAKALEVDQGDATATGLVLGTPAYLAPERFFGSPATVSSDLYSLGVICYEALGGRRPFESGTADAWPRALAGPPPPPLGTLRPGVDPVLAGVVERALARDPADRYASAAEMAADLGGGPGGVVQPEAPPTRVMAPVAGATEVLPRWEAAGPEPTAVYRREVDRRRLVPAILAGLAAVAVIAGIVIALVAAHNGGSGSPATTATTVPGTTAPTSTATTAATTVPTTVPVTATTQPAPTTTAAPPTTAAPATTTPTSAPSTTVTLPITLPTATPGNGNGNGKGNG